MRGKGAIAWGIRFGVHCVAPVTAFVASALTPVFGTNSPQDLPSAESAAIVTKARPALVVLVSTDRRGQPKSFGTGFFISEDGLLVTARHVAQAQEKLLAITQDGQRHPVTGFIGEEPDYDVAVLKIDGSGFPHLRLSTGLPRTNQWVAVISPTDQWPALFNRTNVPPVCSTGVISSVLNLPGLWTALPTTASTVPGQSGSPLLNEAGEVIGLVPYLSIAQEATGSPADSIRTVASKAAAARPVAFAKRPRRGGLEPLVMNADFRAGTQAMGRGDWPEAERRIKRAAKSFRDSPVPLAFLGALCAKRAAWKDVHAHCQRALRLRPESGFLLLLDGTGLIGLGDLPKGMVAVRKSLEAGLSHDLQVSAWELLVRTETALGHRENADKAIEKLRALDGAAATKLSKQLEKERHPSASAERTSS